MEPQRYRCAPAFLLAGTILLLLPLSASAQGKFSSGLRNAMNEVSELIDTGKERHESRFDIRKLEAALHELMHMHHHGDGYAFDQEHHHHGHFTSGLKSTMGDVTKLLGMAVEHDRSRSDLRHLDRALHDLLAALEQPSHHHSRVHDGARNLCPSDGAKATSSPQTDMVGNRVAQKSVIAAPGSAKQGPSNKKDAGPGNLVGQRNPQNVGGVKNNGGATMQHHVKQGAGQQQCGCAKQGQGNFVTAKGAPVAGAAKNGNQQVAGRGVVPGNLVGNRATNKNVATVKNNGGPMQHHVKNNGASAGQACAKQGLGNFAGSKNAGKNTHIAAVAKHGPTTRQPSQAGPGNLVGARTQQACAKNGPGNFAASKNAARLASPTSVAKTSGQAKKIPGNLIGSRPMANSTGASGNQAGVSKHGAGHNNHQATARNGNGNVARTASVKTTAPMQFMPHFAATPHFTAMPHSMPQHFAAAKQGHGNINNARRK